MNKTSSTKYTEWCEKSGISQEIAALNCKPIGDKSKIAAFLGWKGYQGACGWFTQGVDLETGEPTKFGQFKPQRPHKFEDGKTAKYLSPKSGYDAIALRMPDPLYWHRVLDDPTTRIVITEGVKKAAALLTCGIPALALCGVEMGLLEKRSKLVPTLSKLAVKGRPITLAFDMDMMVKPEVRDALIALCSKLKTNGCLVSVSTWDKEHKGIDDLLVASGAQAVVKAMNDDQSYSAWLQGLNTDKDEPLAENLESDLSGLNGMTIYAVVQEKLFSNSHWIAFGNTLYHWEGTHYQARPDEAEHPRIREFCASIPKHNGEGKKPTYPYATPANVRNSLEYVKMGCSVVTEQINPAGVNCTNGVLELHWQGQKLITELVPHDPTRHLYLCEPMVTFDPDADPTEFERLMQCLDSEPRKIWLRTVAAALDLPTVRKYKGRAVKAIFLKGRSPAVQPRTLSSTTRAATSRFIPSEGNGSIGPQRMPMWAELTS
jgi:putative DNA primase/helicase